MILLVLALFLCVFFAYSLYHYKKIHFKFDSAGIKYCPGVPLFGNIWKSTFLRRHFIYDLEEVYNAFPDEKYVGFADGMVPAILVRDPELMKAIVIKDFDHFQNKKSFTPVRLDPLLGRNLLELRDKEWKTTRIQLTPAFSAARLRYMLPAFTRVSQNIVGSLKEHSFQEVELSDSMYRYGGDAAMSAAFGLDQESAGLQSSLFSKLSAEVYLNFWSRLLAFISIQFPNIGEFIKTTTGLQVFAKKDTDFLRRIVSAALNFRKEQSLSIPDYMDVLLKNSEGKSIDDLAGQVFFSWLAGLVSVSSTLKLCFHELALHPEIQERLYQEIRNHEETENMTLEGISGLKYLECVLNETTRKWSTAIMMDRICTKPYVLPPPREGVKPYVVQPGDLVYNVVNAVHMDEKYHANPEVFDPERFSDENKKDIKPFTFMPFGMGPRACIGGRFSVLEMKVMIYYMVLNFKLVKCSKTPDSIRLEPDEINLRAVGGTWVRLEPRQ